MVAFLIFRTKQVNLKTLLDFTIVFVYHFPLIPIFICSIQSHKHQNICLSAAHWKKLKNSEEKTKANELNGFYFPLMKMPCETTQFSNAYTQSHISQPLSVYYTISLVSHIRFSYNHYLTL